MKLIDILVRELPKRGGWPEGAVSVVQSIVDGEIYVYDKIYDAGGALQKYARGYVFERGDDIEMLDSGLTPVITKEQYESALSAAQKQAWNGEGLPPVGCECEYTLSGCTWWPCKVDMYVGTQGVVMSCDVFEGVQYVNRNEYVRLAFRPLRTEADKKRDAAIERMVKVIGITPESAAICYDISLSGGV